MDKITILTIGHMVNQQEPPIEVPPDSQIVINVGYKAYRIKIQENEALQITEVTGCTIVVAPDSSNAIKLL